LPANLKVVELGTSGGGKVVEDNGAMILKMLAQTGSGAAAGSGSSQKPSDQRVAIGGGTGGTGGRGGVPIGGAAGSGGTTGSGSGGTGSGGSHGGGCSAAGSGAERAADIGWCTLALSLLLARRGRRTRA
jgi:hypothetical protein